MKLVLVALIGTCACAAAGPLGGHAKMPMALEAQADATTRAVTVAGPSAAPAPTEAIVVEGSVRIEVIDVGAAAGGLRAQVEGAGGRITDEQLDGGAAAWRGEVKLRIAPDKV